FERGAVCAEFLEETAALVVNALCFPQRKGLGEEPVLPGCPGPFPVCGAGGVRGRKNIHGQRCGRGDGERVYRLRGPPGTGALKQKGAVREGLWSAQVVVSGQRGPEQEA